MCRHLAYLGPTATLAQLLIHPTHSLYEQSFRPYRQRHGTVNADGFGVGWHPAGHDPWTTHHAPVPARRYRRAIPIWADDNFAEIAETIRSHSILAAVRSATADTSHEESAAAPFRREQWLFSHNGAVPDWRHLLADLGETEHLVLDARSDSALLWALAAKRLSTGRELPSHVLLELLREIAAIRPTARLNLLLSDGQAITATAWGDTLWYRQRPDSVIVASEPDEDTGEWSEVPDRSLLVATPDKADVTLISR
ncbi:ergothioneine biosynthesis protein EgtC [Streptomyces sp. NBC_01763]|uniref:ergothioneine biosynthesis protein EgtC n=1 Tax=Streptomyces sp. NBC_01763 TaxID=2975934 RepID=UPI002DD9F514|nr:ergothioneine biosynthesis protein EgtC [Streptomyces sp. NBC_01763]WSC35496.1 ergothioneine biosynthesis protein EgtC [Streptomyces sp. NBC_01763]